MDGVKGEVYSMVLNGVGFGNVELLVVGMVNESISNHLILI